MIARLRAKLALVFGRESVYPDDAALSAGEYAAWLDRLDNAGAFVSYE